MIGFSFLKFKNSKKLANRDQNFFIIYLLNLIFSEREREREVKRFSEFEDYILVMRGKKSIRRKLWDKIVTKVF